MTDTRTYIRVHDGMPDHPKIDALSDRAFRLLVETWCWCSRHLTDGKIPAQVWAKRGTPAARRELESVGLVKVEGDFYLMHDYLQHQRSADEVEATRAQRREAGRAGGKARARNQAKSKRAASEPPSESLSKTQASTETETEVPSNEGTCREDVERICGHLADRIEANGSKRPTVTKAWRDAARLLIDRDGRDEAAVHRAIDWCQDSDFWRGNVLSMPKFRDKYDQMRLQAQRDGNVRPLRPREDEQGRLILPPLPKGVFDQ